MNVCIFAQSSNQLERDLSTKLELCHHISLAFPGPPTCAAYVIAEDYLGKPQYHEQTQHGMVMIKYPPKGPIKFNIKESL